MQKKHFFLIFSFLLSLLLYVTIYILGEIQRASWLPGAGPPLNIIPIEYIDYFVVILPGPLWTDIIMLYLLPVVVFFIFFALAPYLNIAFLKIHKFIYRFNSTKPQYGIVKVGVQVKAIVIFRRTLVASLFSFSIAGLFAQAGFGFLFRANIVEGFVLNEAEALFLGTFFIAPFTLLLFLPFWHLEDSGTVAYFKYERQRKATRIEGTHALFLNILEGYAGISTIILLVSYVIGSFAEIGFGSPAILTPLILIFLPFIMTGLYAIPMFIYERMLEKSQNKLHKKLEKLDFVVIEVPIFDDMKKSGETG